MLKKNVTLNEAEAPKGGRGRRVSDAGRRDAFSFFFSFFSFRLQTTADVESRACVIYVNNLYDDLDHDDE